MSLRRTKTPGPHPLRRSATVGDMATAYAAADDSSSDSLASSTASCPTDEDSLSNSPSVQARRRRNRFTGAPFHMVVMLSDLNFRVVELSVVVGNFDQREATRIRTAIGSFEACEGLVECVEVIYTAFDKAERAIELAHTLVEATLCQYVECVAERVQIIETEAACDIVCMARECSRLELKLEQHQGRQPDDNEEYHHRTEERNRLRLRAHASLSRSNERNTRMRIEVLKRNISVHKKARKRSLTAACKEAAKKYDRCYQALARIMRIGRLVEQLRMGTLQELQGE